MNRFSFERNSSDDAWFKAGTLDVTTTVLVTAICASSFLVFAISPKLLAPLVLDPIAVRSGQIWRVFTWPFVNQPELFAVLTLAVFYMFGRELERIIGRIKFAWMLGFLIVVPGFAAIVLYKPIFGLQHVEIAVFLIFVMLNPMARSFFNIPLWVLGAVFLAINVLQLVGLRDWNQLAFQAIVLGTALLCMGAFDLSENYPWIPKIPLPQFITRDPYQKSNRERERRQRAQQRNAPRQSSSASRPASRRKGAEDNVVPLRNQSRPEPRLGRADQADMDTLLDKISASGIDSLTPDERRRLDDLSRRLRGEA